MKGLFVMRQKLININLSRSVQGIDFAFTGKHITKLLIVGVIVAVLSSGLATSAIAQQGNGPVYCLKVKDRGGNCLDSAPADDCDFSNCLVLAKCYLDQGGTLHCELYGYCNDENKGWVYVNQIGADQYCGSATEQDVADGVAMLSSCDFDERLCFLGGSCKQLCFLGEDDEWECDTDGNSSYRTSFDPVGEDTEWGCDTIPPPGQLALSKLDIGASATLLAAIQKLPVVAGSGGN